MDRIERDNSAGFTLGLISGVVVGAGLALLFAPKAGSTLRGELAGSVDALRSAIADRSQELAARADVEIDHLRETVDSAADGLESRAKAAVQSAARKLRSVEPAV